jgi:hypothetical protein
MWHNHPLLLSLEKINKKQLKPEALKSLYRSPGNKKNRLTFFLMLIGNPS